ncbi:Uncharacterised protein [uncultured archaeon]|nr:Uncharacterised protein [uncultured archaeon]
MERLTKLQNLILKRLNKDSTKYIEETVLFGYIMEPAMNKGVVHHPDDFQEAIRSLMQRKLVMWDNRPNMSIRITEEGMEKLKFISLIKDIATDYKELLTVVAIIISVIFGIITLRK